MKRKSSCFWSKDSIQLIKLANPSLMRSTRVFISYRPQLAKNDSRMNLVKVKDHLGYWLMTTIVFAWVLRPSWCESYLGQSFLSSLLPSCSIWNLFRKNNFVFCVEDFFHSKLKLSAFIACFDWDFKLLRKKVSFVSFSKFSHSRDRLKINSACYAVFSPLPPPLTSIFFVFLLAWVAFLMLWNRTE